MSAHPLLEMDFASLLLECFGHEDVLLAIYSCAEEPRAIALLNPAGFMGWITFQPSQAPSGLLIPDGDVGADPARLSFSVVRSLPGMPLQLSYLHQDPDCLD